MQNLLAGLGLRHQAGQGRQLRHRLVVVLGMHRSGTSLCSNILHELGIDMAEDAGESPANKRGHWERARINDLNDMVFACFGRSWQESGHVLALPDGWLSDPRVQAVRQALAACLAPHVEAGRAGFKDPRTARLMPLWKQVFAALDTAPRYVLCVRDPAQVARSLSARDRMAREQAEYRWLIYNAEAVAGIAAAPVCVIPYEDWFTAPEENASRLAAFVGKSPLERTRIAAIVDPSLRHDVQDVPPAYPLARRLHRHIISAIPAGRFDADATALCATVAEFQIQVQPLLVEMEVLRSSVVEQNRVIADLNGLVRQLRAPRAA